MGSRAQRFALGCSTFGGQAASMPMACGNAHTDSPAMPKEVRKRVPTLLGTKSWANTTIAGIAEARIRSAGSSRYPIEISKSRASTFISPETGHNAIVNTSRSFNGWLRARGGSDLLSSAILSESNLHDA